MRFGARVDDAEVLEDGVASPAGDAERWLKAIVPDGVAPQAAIGPLEPAVERVGDDVGGVVDIDEAVQAAHRLRLTWDSICARASSTMRP